MLLVSLAPSLPYVIPHFLQQGAGRHSRFPHKWISSRYAGAADADILLNVNRS